MKKNPTSNWLGKAVCNAIRAHRIALALSQDELGKRCGLHRTYISDIERGTRNMSLQNLQKLAEALEMMPSQLISQAEKLKETE